MVQSIEVLLSTFRKKKFYFNVVFSNELLATRSDSRFCEPFNLFSKHIVYNWIRGQDNSLIWRIARIKVCSLQIENKSINKYESHVCHEDSVQITFTIPAIETVCVNENVQESKWAEKKRETSTFDPNWYNPQYNMRILWSHTNFIHSRHSISLYLPSNLITTVIDF